MNYKEIYKQLTKNKIYTLKLYENIISIELSISKHNTLNALLYVGNALFITRSAWHQEYTYNDFVNIIKDLLNQCFDSFKKGIICDE